MADFLTVFPYGIMFVLFLAVLAGTAAYAFRSRKQLDEMHGMMAGMTLGMMAGLATGALVLIPTGNFLIGVIAGSLAGLAFGIPSGKLGGHLGIMEGVVAGPMGGMMGAMLGQMIRPFSIEVFMPFFTAVFLLTLAGISYAIHCGASCCGPDGKKQKPAKLSETFITSWVLAAIFLLGLSIFLPFAVGTNDGTTKTTTGTALNLPPALQALTQETRGEAVMRDGYQEIDMRVTAYGYKPNTIVAKRGVPLRIHATAEPGAGCGRNIVFPNFGVNTIIPEGEAKTISLDLSQGGTYDSFAFSCSMDMMHGKIIVQ
jgi:hypothetical protein